MFRVWLNPNELNFLNSYAEQNMLTASELIRFWIRQAMEKEGVIGDMKININPLGGGKSNG